MTAIVILALVALFIGLRLYNVLGERTGHEQPISKPAEAEAEARPAKTRAPAAPAGAVAAPASDGNDMALAPSKFSLRM